MTKIKILHLLSSLEVAGAQKVVFDICRLRNRKKFDAIVVGISHQEDMRNVFEEEEIPVEILNTQKTIISVWKSLKKLSSLIKREKIKVVHAHMSHPIFLGVLLKMRHPSLKLIFTSHNFNLGSTLRELFIFLTKGIRNADIIFSKKMFRSIYKKNAVIIPNGIDTTDYHLNIPKFKRFTFVCIGRLAAAKNQLALIKPIKKLLQKGHNFQVFIVGEGKNRAKIEQALAANQLTDHIQLLGLRRDIPQLCNQAHCLLLPSLWEGLPIVLLEAGASSLPIISSKVGSIPSLIDVESGYLLNDQISDIETQIELVLTDYETALKKAKKLKEKIKKQFDINVIVQKHEVIYSKVATHKATNLQYELC